MADGLNKVQLIGNLGQDPELRFTQGQTPVMTIRMATQSSFFSEAKKERIERVEWHTVIVWGKRAEGLNKVLSKGFRIYVEGELQTRKWQDKSGADRWTTEITAREIILLGEARGGHGRDGSSGSSRAEDHEQRGERADAPDDDDIPF